MTSLQLIGNVFEQVAETEGQHGAKLVVAAEGNHLTDDAVGAGVEVDAG